MSFAKASIVGMIFLITLAMALVFQRRRAARLRWHRVRLYVGEKLTASFPVLAEKPVSLIIRHTGSDGKARYERMRVYYSPHNLLGVALDDQTFYIPLNDVEYAERVRDELNLRIFAQRICVHATQAELTVSLQITRPPARPAQPMAAVHPRLKIIARRKAA